MAIRVGIVGFRATAARELVAILDGTGRPSPGLEHRSDAGAPAPTRTGRPARIPPPRRPRGVRCSGFPGHAGGGLVDWRRMPAAGIRW
jgi:hypothetical protein